MTIDTKGIGYREINNLLRCADSEIKLTSCMGQRFIGAGISDKSIEIEGIPGNALGAYLNGATITVNGNVQDAVGDTMNSGEIIIRGNAGDAVGYAMRGGKIFIKGNAGYRAGIHMKAFKDKTPVMVIGGTAGSFLGEYQAGGIIIVLGLGADGRKTGYFPCTGMHGGKMFIKGNCSGIDFPAGVDVKEASSADIEEIKPYLLEYCSRFEYNEDELLTASYSLITPDSKNPYKQMYVAN
ncbi:MAG: glutamate synthase [Clostridia bacterium]|nr:glutamate synthase [Clostridia bacterium]